MTTETKAVCWNKSCESCTSDNITNNGVVTPISSVLSSCSHTNNIKLYACGRCKRAKYCSTKCQKENRKNHKYMCYNVSTLDDVILSFYSMVDKFTDLLSNISNNNTDDNTTTNNYSTVVNLLVHITLSRLGIDNKLVCGYLKFNDGMLLRHTWIELYSYVDKGSHYNLESIRGASKDLNEHKCKYECQGDEIYNIEDENDNTTYFTELIITTGLSDDSTYILSNIGAMIKSISSQIPDLSTIIDLIVYN